jgi:hypothetical protein
MLNYAMRAALSDPSLSYYLKKLRETATVVHKWLPMISGLALEHTGRTP